MSERTDRTGDGRVDAGQQVKNVSTNYLALAVSFASVLILTAVRDPRAHLRYLGLLDLGLRPSVVKFVAEHRARGEQLELREYVSSVFVLYLGAGVVAIVAAIGLSTVAGNLLDLEPELRSAATAVCLVGGVGVAAALMNGLAGGVLEGFQRYDWNNSIAMVAQTVIFVGTLVLLGFGRGLLDIVVLQVSAATLGMAARMILVRWRLAVRISARSFRTDALRKGVSYATWAFVLAIATQIVFQADSLIISLTLSVALVTVYSVAWRMVEAVNRVVAQTVSVCLPLFSDLEARSQMVRQREVFVESLRVAMAIAVPCHVTFLLIGDRIIDVWIGPGYAASYSVLVVLSLTFLIHVPAHVSAILLLGTGRHRSLALISVAAALLNVVLSVALGRWIGVVGVALATGISFAISLSVIVPLQAIRQIELGVRKYVTTLAGPLLVGAAIFSIGVALEPWPAGPASLWELAITTAAIFVTFFIALVALGMSPADRSRYVRGMRRALNRKDKQCSSA